MSRPTIASVGDPAAVDRVSCGAFGGYETEIPHQLAGVLKARQIADLGQHRHCRNEIDPAHRLQGCDELGKGPEAMTAVLAPSVAPTLTQASWFQATPFAPTAATSMTLSSTRASRTTTPASRTTIPAKEAMTTGAAPTLADPRWSDADEPDCLAAPTTGRHTSAPHPKAREASQLAAP